MGGVAGSRFGRGNIVGGVSQPNMPYILNLFRNSLRGKAINYRPYASHSFEVARHVKNCHFGN